MPDDGLREALLALAGEYRMRAENLLSDKWHEAFSDLPTLRQRQYGSAVEALWIADKLVRLLGMEPDSVWPESPRSPSLPDEERGKLMWPSDSDAQ